jgi:hypothetical protein
MWRRDDNKVRAGAGTASNTVRRTGKGALRMAAFLPP